MFSTLALLGLLGFAYAFSGMFDADDENSDADLDSENQEEAESGGFFDNLLDNIMGAFGLDAPEEDETPTGPEDWLDHIAAPEDAGDMLDALRGDVEQDVEDDDSFGPDTPDDLAEGVEEDTETDEDQGDTSSGLLDGSLTPEELLLQALGVDELDSGDDEDDAETSLQRAAATLAIGAGDDLYDLALWESSDAPAENALHIDNFDPLHDQIRLVVDTPSGAGEEAVQVAETDDGTGFEIEVDGVLMATVENVRLDQIGISPVTGEPNIVVA